MKHAIPGNELIDRLRAAVEMHRAGGSMAEALQAAFPDRKIIDPRATQQAETRNHERLGLLNGDTGETDLDF